MSTSDVMKHKHQGRHYISEFKLISKALMPKRYFEIGTRAGQSLRQFECDAVCVDPRFGINADSILKRVLTLFYQMTSDVFFEKYNPVHLLGGTIDIAFLDGMHHFEYLLRDFINTEKYCRRTSVIMLHDCLPPHPFMARRSIQDGNHIKELLKGVGTTGLKNDKGEDIPLEKLGWAGDVYRVLFILKQFRPDLRIHYYNCPPTGLVIVSNLNPESTVLQDNYFEAVDMAGRIELDYAKLDELFNLYPMIDTTAAAADAYSMRYTVFS